MQRLEEHALDRDAADKGQAHRQDEGHPVGHSPGDQLPGEKGREGRHLALREIEVVDRLVDHHDGERDERINGAVRKTGHNLLEE